jgi:hypothetical protein
MITGSPKFITIEGLGIAFSPGIAQVEERKYQTYEGLNAAKHYWDLKHCYIFLSLGFVQC